MLGARLFKYILKILTLVFCVAFVVLNMQEATLYYSPIANPIVLPLWLLGIVLFSVGFVVGGLLIWLSYSPVRYELRQTRKNLKAVEKDREKLEDDVRQNSARIVDERIENKQAPL